MLNKNRIDLYYFNYFVSFQQQRMKQNIYSTDVHWFLLDVIHIELKTKSRYIKIPESALVNAVEHFM